MYRGSSGADCGGRWGILRGKCPAALIVGFLILQFGCFFRHKAPSAADVPPPIVRIVLLPLNTPPEDSSLSWLSLAVPALMAHVGRNAPDLEIVPLWESMPVTVEAMGASRSIGPDQAAYIAGRLTAKWAATGEVTPVKNGISILIDFIPTKETVIPFRYEKQVEVDSMQGNIRDAFTQFLRYQTVRPITAEIQPLNAGSLRDTAQALDLEYGWFTPSEPGKSEKIVNSIAGTDNKLAQMLFNPNLYPAIARTAPPGKK